MFCCRPNQAQTRYIADMYDLRTNHPNTWRELEACNISVTKNEIPFVSIVANHACEHLNKLMKVSVIGILNKVMHRQTRVLRVCTRSSCPSREFKSQFSVRIGKATEHSPFGPSAVKIGKTRSIKSRLRSCVMTNHLPLKVTSCTIWPLMSTSQRVRASYPKHWRHQGEVVWSLCVRENQWGRQPVCTSEKTEQQDVLIWQQERMCGNPGQDADLKETKYPYDRLMVPARSNRGITRTTLDIS